MPELPDLTVYAENLAKALTGKKVNQVAYHRRGKLNVAEVELSKAVTGAEVTGVERAGKQVAFRLGNGNLLRVHLMLTGGFALTDSTQLDRLRYPVLTVAFDDGSLLAVTDEKGWASVTLSPGDERDAPDALAVTAEQLEQLCRKKPRTLIKPLLLDQSLIGGIGNAYADEILWTARISPKSPAGKLPPEAIRALADAIPQVLEDAIAELRKRHPDMVSGEYREFLKVHRPELKTSPTGARIIKENVQSKRTYYTDEQQLYQ
ncbi:Fpg/Nei family DNA glycosylase [Geomonas agri]|uniref:Fpg/Nei family DNA glycosylase n=1 Tax=Geomonas agri TaxID=2873702 RepID=UPI001CD1A25A|nr:DNA-formamidopyrimidine glycosylase family protein [Geomonas agri]